MAGVVTGSGSEKRDWDLDAFVQAIRAGERFYVRECGASLELDLAVCDRCPRLTISPVIRSRKA